MQTRTWRDRGIAWGVVLAWHLFAGWWLLHALPGTRRDLGDDVLHVVYVAVPLPSPPPPTLQVRDVPVPAHRGNATHTARQQASIATMTGVPDSTSAPSSSPTLVDQARSLVQQRAHAAPTFTHNPLADRPADIPKADAGRFRMHAQITPASAIAWVGQHITAPAGYEQDPCPRNKRNIAGLLAQGDSSRLQMELEYERRHCSP